MPAPEPRSAEEWAEACHRLHGFVRSLLDGMCLSCARAFAAQETATLQTELETARRVIGINIREYRIVEEDRDALQQRVEALETVLQRISDLKDEAYAIEPVSRETADVVARNVGRIAKAALRSGETG